MCEEIMKKLVILTLAHSRLYRLRGNKILCDIDAGLIHKSNNIRALSAYRTVIKPRIGLRYILA